MKVIKPLDFVTTENLSVVVNKGNIVNCSQVD